MTGNYIPLTKENQRSKAHIKNKHGRLAWIGIINWGNRGCWIYYKHPKKYNNSDLIEYKDFKNWFIEKVEN